MYVINYSTILFLYNNHSDNLKTQDLGNILNTTI